jgi:hypothetical protein
MAVGAEFAAEAAAGWSTLSRLQLIRISTPRAITVNFMGLFFITGPDY